MEAVTNDKLCILNTTGQNAFAIMEGILLSGQIPYVREVSDNYLSSLFPSYRLYINEKDRDLVKDHLKLWANEVEALILQYPKRPVVFVNEEPKQEPAGVV